MQGSEGALHWRAQRRGLPALPGDGQEVHILATQQQHHKIGRHTGLASGIYRSKEHSWLRPAGGMRQLLKTGAPPIRAAQPGTDGRRPPRNIGTGAGIGPF